MTPTERTAVADWIEARHLAGELRGMSMDQVAAVLWTELAVEVDHGQIFGAIMEAGSRRARRLAAARLGDTAGEPTDTPLFALAPMEHEDDGGED